MGTILDNAYLTRLYLLKRLPYINFCFFEPKPVNRAAKILEETLAVQEVNRALNRWEYDKG